MLVKSLKSYYRRLNSQDDSHTELYSEVVGRGDETLVFVAGLGGTTRYWKPRLGQLENNYRLVLVDLLGFGNSPKPWCRYSVDRHIEALRKTLKPLGSITLIGHSLGALLTVAYAARYPENINKIVNLSMPYFGSQKLAYRYMRYGPIRGGYIFSNTLLTMAVCVFTRRVIGRLLPYMLRDIPREVAEDLVKHTWRSSTSSLWEVVYRYDASGDLSGLPARIGILFIHGDADVTAPFAAIQRLIANRPQWRLRVLHDVDHHPFLRNASDCIALIEESLEQSNEAGLAKTSSQLDGSELMGNELKTS